jgi:hypothetical protein
MALASELVNRWVRRSSDDPPSRQVGLAFMVPAPVIIVLGLALIVVAIAVG